MTPPPDRGHTSPAIEGPPPHEFQLFFYHGDHLGSSNVITDAFAGVFEHVEYFPFGEPWVEDGGTATLLPYKFTSKELDPETGLYYYGARYYEPRLQRWLSPDPIFEAYLTSTPHNDVYRPVNINLYRYAANNPLRLTDPTGLAEQEDDLTRQLQELDPHRRLAAFREAVTPIISVIEAAASVHPFIGGTEAGTGQSSIQEQQLSTPERVASVPVIGGILKLLRVEKLLQKLFRLEKVAAKTEEVVEAGRVIAKSDLTPAQLAKLTRFEKKLPKAAGEATVRDLPGGGKIFQAEVPGQVPGSKAIYEKQVDAFGNTISYTKTTVAPDGSIVHVKQKFP